MCIRNIKQRNKQHLTLPKLAACGAVALRTCPNSAYTNHCSSAVYDVSENGSIVKFKVEMTAICKIARVRKDKLEREK